MKTHQDPRHKRRIKRFKRLFGYSFQPELLAHHPRIEKIVSQLPTIDDNIAEVAPEWPINRLNKIDLAILRLGVYELLIEKKIPPKVVIDEGVELGKKYGTENTPKFVNGVLGKLLEMRQANITEQEAANQSA